MRTASKANKRRPAHAGGTLGFGYDEGEGLRFSASPRHPRCGARRRAELLHEDLVYWTIGKPHLFPYAGTRGKAEFVAYLATPSIFVGGSRMTPLVMTAEDNRVSITVEGEGTMPDGRVYTNVYHYLFSFRDGQIVEVREYMDTQSAAEFFGV